MLRRHSQTLLCEISLLILVRKKNDSKLPAVNEFIENINFHERRHILSITNGQANIPILGNYYRHSDTIKMLKQ
jgi:hypothetical protein